MSVRKRIALSQNFLKKRHVVIEMLDQSSINDSDIVYEIGPGTGMITKELSAKAKQVIAIEKDIVLYQQLERKFKKVSNIILYNWDFMKFVIRHSRYKVFANIPFNITSAIVRKLLYTENSPEETYLVMQKEVAQKLTGVPKTFQFSVLTKPWFTFRIIRMFKRTDFFPIPSVDVVMLHVKKRKQPLIMRKDSALYEQFVKLGFNAWKKNLKQNYKGVFTHTQWKRLSQDLHFSFHAVPSDLDFEQWLSLYEFYTKSRDLLR